MRHTLALVVPVLLLSACKAPPPAPEGLDASASHMIREFYSDDATFEAGLTGFIRWFDDEGYELLDLEATLENVTEAFTVGLLSEADIGYLPLEHGRTISNAAGVVSLAEMDCGVTESEDLLIRSDQDTVFEDWEGYDRTYMNSRSDHQDATRSGEYVEIPDPVDPFADDFDPAPLASTLLFTFNQVNPTPIFNGLADLDAYPMHLDLRHGLYDIDGEEIQIFAIITFITESAVGPAGANFLHQSYSVELNVARPDGRTLRMLAVWAEPEGAGLEPDSPAVLRYAVDKSAGASKRLTEICDGTIEIPAEG